MNKNKKSTNSNSQTARTKTDSGAYHTSRRDFIKVLSYSAGAAALFGACQQPIRKVIPYVIQPDSFTPGKSVYYATSFINGRQFFSIKAKTQNARPIKLDGNDKCPLNQGGSTSQLQASLLNEYDEDRIQYPQHLNKLLSWDQIDSEIIKRLDDLVLANKKVLLLADISHSPSTNQVFEDFEDYYPNIDIIQYERNSHSALIEVHKQAFGKKVVPNYAFNNAKYIVSFHADFLGTYLSPIEYSKQYAQVKSPESDNLVKHIHLESEVTITGSQADIRIPIDSIDEYQILQDIYQHLTLENKISNQSIRSILDQLRENKENCVVLSSTNDFKIQLLVCLINQQLGNYGKTIFLDEPENKWLANDTILEEKLKQLHTGHYSGLITYHSNPVYDFKSLKLDSVIKNLEFSVNVSWYNNETSLCSQFICPDNYYLESWNDHQPRSNYFAVQQPVIRPLFNTRQGQESLLRWMKKTDSFYHFIQNYWKKQVFVDSESSKSFIPRWNKTLQRGFYKTSDEKLFYQFHRDQLDNNLLQRSGNKTSSTKLILKLVNCIHTFNDDFSNNPWLQELPHPITKICWDNYASISPVIAKEHRLATGDIVLLNNTIEIPVVVQAGQHPNVISVSGGFGRTNTGRIVDELGVSINKFFGFKDGYRQCEVSVSIEKTNKKHEFAITQEEASMHGRDIVRYVNADKLKSLSKKKHSEASLYKKHEYKQFHWGMAIDLNKCTGCSACVISCQAENNIPVVGKSEIAKRREMHWLRIDRYYEGDDKNPKVLFQPVMCQHCDQAPCENVCPVSATTHSSEGINQMVYSRCVGTRYCSNNCPYKVRRFNWFDYTKADAFNNNTHDPFGMTNKIPSLVLNPDVTVRSKGVNEKCSFCFQRIAEAKIKAKKDNRALIDGEIQTACMQACPSDAIIFGDMNDENSSISKLIKNNRSYTLLDELHTLPSVHYMSKVINNSNKKTKS